MNIFNLTAKIELDDGNYTKKLKQAAKGNQDLGDSAEEAKQGLTKQEKATKALSTVTSKASSVVKGFGSVISGIGKTSVGVVAGIGAISGAIVGISKSTEDGTEDMNRLNLAFESAGHSSETAGELYKSFLGTLGESDRAIETANHLAELTKNVEELGKWGNIVAGVNAKFGDSLPVEGLTEASNESAKTGQVIGVLADALNWAGISEDDFNTKLASLSSESERATLITNTLSGEYSELGKAFNEANADIIASRQATDNFNKAIGEIGAAVRPAATEIINFGTTVIKDLVAVFNGDMSVSEAINNMFSKLDSGIKFVTSILNGVIEALPLIIDGGVQIITALFEALIANLPLLIDGAVQIINALLQGIVDNLPMIVEGALTLLTTLIDTLIQNLPLIIQAATQLLQGLLQGLISAIPLLIDGAVQLVMALVQFIIDNISLLIEASIEIVTAILTGLLDNLPLLIEGAIDLVLAIIEGIIENLPLLIEKGPEIIEAIIEGIIGAFGSIFDAGKDLVQELWDGVLSMASWLTNKISNWFSNIFGGVKDDFEDEAYDESSSGSGKSTKGLSRSVGFNQSTLSLLGATSNINRSVNFTQNIIAPQGSSASDNALYTRNALYSINKGGNGK